MAIDISTNNYLEDYCNKFVNENITKPIFEFSSKYITKPPQSPAGVSFIQLNSELINLCLEQLGLSA